MVFLQVEKIQQASKREEEQNQITLESNRSQFVAKSLAIFKLFSSNSQIQQDFIEGKDNAVVKLGIFGCTLCFIIIIFFYLLLVPNS